MAKKKQKAKKYQSIAFFVMLFLFIFSFIIPYLFNKRYSQPLGYIIMGVSICIPMAVSFFESKKFLKEAKEIENKDPKTIQKIKTNKFMIFICCLFSAIFLILPVLATVSLIQGPKTIRIVNPSIKSQRSGGRYRYYTYDINGRREFGTKQESFGTGQGYDLKEVNELMEEYEIIEIDYYEAMDTSCAIRGVKKRSE